MVRSTVLKTWPTLVICFPNISREYSKAAGSAPWKLKIDCLRSPTTNNVRSGTSRLPVPEKNSFRQRIDDLPLGQAGVLRFVDKDMLNAAIQLEQNPLRRCLVDKQVTGFQDEIVEVIGAAEFFGRFEFRNHRLGEGEQGTRRFNAREIVNLLDQVQAARIFI